MYCINCGTKNEDDSKFCIGCGQKIEEETVVEETTPQEIKPEEPKEEIKPISTEPKSNNNMTPIIIIGVIVGIIVLGIAVNFIYNDFIKPKVNNPIPTKKSNKPSKVSDWEINYTIPKEFEESIYSQTLKTYKYNKNNVMCSLTIWKITYIKDGETEESIMRQYSNSTKKDELEIKNVKINGRNWKYLEDKGSFPKYEYGMFDSTKENFYSIKYTDYDPDKGVCKKYLDEIIKSITYNK